MCARMGVYIYMSENVSCAPLRKCVVCPCVWVDCAPVSTLGSASNIIMPACVSELAVTYWFACVFVFRCMCMLV